MRESDLRRVQPPDAENRMSGGGEGARGAIPAPPSDQSECGSEGRQAKALPAYARSFDLM